MTLESFSLDQIKKAYWEEFHESGELWFDYLGNEEENEGSTIDGWTHFLEVLNKQ